MYEEGTTHFTLAQSATSGALVLTIGGEIDAATGPAASTTLNDALDGLPPPDVVVADLSTVAYISAAGVRVLATIRRACLDRQLVFRIVAAADTIVRRVLLIAGLKAGTDIFATLDDALGVS